MGGGRNKNAGSDRKTPREQTISFSSKEDKPSQEPHIYNSLLLFVQIPNCA